MCFEQSGASGGQEVRRATAVNPSEEPIMPTDRAAAELKSFGKSPTSDYSFTPGSTDLFNYKSTGVQSPLLQSYMRGLSPWKQPNSTGLGN